VHEIGAHKVGAVCTKLVALDVVNASYALDSPQGGGEPLLAVGIERVVKVIIPHALQLVEKRHVLA
jgi:hypothetical protein